MRDALTGRMVEVPEQERFWAKVQKTDGCWLWTGAQFGNGYGAFKRRVGDVFKQQKAHRVAYELAYVAAPPNDLFVCHHCDNPQCVRPDHLFLGTGSDNQQDMQRKGRSNYYHPPRLDPEERRRRRNKYLREHYARNREKMRAYHREWERRHRETAA